jgi:hypothetical protein
MEVKILDRRGNLGRLITLQVRPLTYTVVGGSVLSNGSKSSLWWRDVIGVGRGFVDDWFKSNIECCVNNGKNIGFWKFKWFENQPFCDLYPALFAKETNKDALVFERMNGLGLEPTWRWEWNDSLTDIQNQQVEELK